MSKKTDEKQLKPKNCQKNYCANAFLRDILDKCPKNFIHLGA